MCVLHLAMCELLERDMRSLFDTAFLSVPTLVSHSFTYIRGCIEMHLAALPEH